jgi:hypothetical protein
MSFPYEVYYLLPCKLLAEPITRTLPFFPSPHRSQRSSGRIHVKDAAALRAVAEGDP